jgi:hypothetical protein
MILRARRKGGQGISYVLSPIGNSATAGFSNRLS